MVGVWCAILVPIEAVIVRWAVLSLRNAQPLRIYFAV
jgi:hypothetical protein